MNTLWSNRRAGILALALFLTGCAADQGSVPPARVGSEPYATAPAVAAGFINVHALIIIRHADINVATKKTLGDQTPLTARGDERAKELAYAFKDAGITRIVTSETLRTRETGAILAKEIGITPETPFGHGGTSPSSAAASGAHATYSSAKKQEAAAVFAYLADTGKPTDIVLLVHHHSVIPDLMKLLGYTDEPPYAEGVEFDRIYVVLPDPATHSYRVFRLRYGGDWHTK